MLNSFEIEGSQKMTVPPPYSKKEQAALLKKCAETIARGSKSFSLAAQLFDKRTRNGAIALYAWARAMDDLADDSAYGFYEEGSRKPGNKIEVINSLKEKTQQAYQGHTMTDPAFQALQYVAWRHEVPITYPLELLEGMMMDAKGARYETINDLLLYCYRVAGVVGLMMSHVMGVSDKKALQKADALGKAMQLTNICRDVVQDAEQGRVYLPLDWLNEMGVDPTRVADPKNRKALHDVAKRILAVADVYYLSGDTGVQFLPFRASLAVSCARRIYAQIGTKILKAGRRAWDERQIVSSEQKAIMVIGGLFQAVRSRPLWRGRLWRPIQINDVWRHA